MALTLQEIIAKRNELQKTNPNATNVEARQALMANPPTPVVTDTSVPTPVTPTAQPVIQQMAGMNVQERQAVRNEQPATPVPVVPETPIPEAPTKITPDSYQQANIESEKIKAQNEAQMKLNTQQAQLKEQERQNVAKETAIANTPTDTQGILSSLVAGVPIAPQKTGNYINAKFQYDQYSKFNAMTPTQMLDNLKQGQIGTEMDKLLSQNPNYIQAKTELDKIQKTNNSNNNIKNIYWWVKWTTTETPDYLSMVSNELMTKLGLDKDMTSAEAFAQYVTGDQKIVDYTNQLSNTNRQIADTSKLINDGIKELKSRKWDMPADALVVLLNSTFRDVNETLTNLNNTKTYLEADLKNASEMAFNRFNAVSKDIENSRTIKNSVISNLIQSQFSLANKMQENELANQIAKEAMNDPYKAIPSMIEEYKKLGIPFTRSIQQVIQDFETSWQDLSTYLSDLQKTIQTKPEYQKIKELQMGQLSDAQKMTLWYQQDINKMAISNQYDIKRMWLEQDFQMAMAQAKNVTSNKWTKLDDGMYTNEAGEIITADELKSAKLLGNSYITKQVWEEWGDCWFYASRGTGMSATPGGNSKDARKQAFSETTPQVWGMAFFGGAGYDPTYGHISIVTGVNADWTITVKESNYGNDKKVTERTVPANSVTGYYNNTPLAKQGAQGTFTATEEAWANNIMNGKAKISDITTKDNVDKGKVLQLMNQKTGGTTGTMQTNIQSWLEIVNSLINHPWFTDVIWVPSIFANPLGYSLPGTSARDFKAEIKRMEAIGFLNMIPQMQGMGALSNSEGSRLAAAYSKLSDTGIGETEYKAELTRLKEWMEKALKNMWATIPEETKQTTNTGWWQTVGGELNYSKYE